MREGLQVDLDLGNYERFLDVTLTRDNNLTTGKIYQVRPLKFQRLVGPSGGLFIAPFLCWRSLPCSWQLLFTRRDAEGLRVKFKMESNATSSSAAPCSLQQKSLFSQLVWNIAMGIYVILQCTPCDHHELQQPRLISHRHRRASLTPSVSKFLRRTTYAPPEVQQLWQHRPPRFKVIIAISLYWKGEGR